MPRTLEYEDKETIKRIIAGRKKNDALDIKTPLSRKRSRPRKEKIEHMAFTNLPSRALEQGGLPEGYSLQLENLELFRRYGRRLDQVDEAIRRLALLTLLGLGLSIVVMLAAAMLINLL